MACQLLFHRNQPNCVVSGDGLYSGQSTTKLSNTVPIAIYGDYDFAGVDFSATLSVNDSNFDDYHIGFIFSAADQSSLYVAQWKKRNQSAVSLDAESTWALPNSGAGLRVLLHTGPNGRLQSNYAFARAGLNIKRVNGNVREGALWRMLDAISHLDPFNVSDTKVVP